MSEDTDETRSCNLMTINISGEIISISGVGLTRTTKCSCISAKAWAVNLISIKGEIAQLDDCRSGSGVCSDFGECSETGEESCGRLESGCRDGGTSETGEEGCGRLKSGCGDGGTSEEEGDGIVDGVEISDDGCRDGETLDDCFWRLGSGLDLRL